MIPCISNAVSGVLLLIKRMQKFLRKLMGSSEAMGWAARDRQGVYIMPYNLGNHYIYMFLSRSHALLMPFLLLLGWFIKINSLVCSICVPVMILKMPFIFLFGWFVKSNRLLCMPFKSREVHGRRTVIVIFIKYV